MLLELPDTSMDRECGIRPWLWSRQPRDPPGDGKKLVIRQPINKNNSNKEWGP